ncbi:MAG: MCE family protein [Solirubrobacterales bacterium]|nr:MCE family protein [Solirubrobacterales bacterium]MBV9916377.1 MCE family protein [Solirubrobacterales bacterium]
MRRGRRRRRSLSLFTTGAIGIVVLAVLTYLAFTKFANPFASPFTVHAVFSRATGLRPDSLVRIAGVDVGKVTGIKLVSSCRDGGSSQAQCAAADVTMTIDKPGLPLHTDATFRIRPRIFLEGDFFLDVSPGTPAAAEAPDGYTFPIQQGVEPVQLDQVLTSLQLDTRQNLQTLLQQYGQAVKVGGPAYNASIQYWLPAFRSTSMVAHDALGIQPHDLSNWIAAQGSVAGAFSAHPENLKSLITDLNATAAAFARQDVALRRAVAELPTTLSAATPAFNALNAAFPPLRALARTLVPGVQSAGPAIDASLPFITQLRLLVRPSELEGLATDLARAAPSLAQLSNETVPLMLQGVRPASSCAATVVYPWSQLSLPDPHFNARNGFPPRKVYVEAVDYLPGLAGESRNFDANGAYIRVLLTAGSLTYSLSPRTFGQAVAPLIATQPTLPPGSRRPPLEPGVPCETQPPISDLSSPTGPALSQLR